MRQKKVRPLLDYLEIIVKWRKFIIRNAIIVTIAAAIISLLLPQRFTATATMLPPNPEQTSFIGMLSANIPSELSGLAKIGGGILPGVSTPSDLYAAIIRSGTIAGAIIKKYDLKKEFKAKTSYDAARALENITQISVTPEGIIAVSITYKDKYLAAEIANSYIEELDKFNNETAMTAGKKYRIFIENRLTETEEALANAEDSLRGFQEKHKTVALDVEIQSAIQTVAELKSQILLLEAKKGVLASTSQINNPYLYNIEKELKALKKQLMEIEFGDEKSLKNGFGAGFSMPFSKLPEITLEYVRLVRDVKIQEATYELLTQQYEQAKIMELKDTPTVQMLDKAGPPEKRSFPKRRIIVIIALLCSLIVSIAYAFAVHYMQSGAISVDTNKKLKSMWDTLKSDLSNILQAVKRIFKK